MRRFIMDVSKVNLVYVFVIDYINYNFNYIVVFHLQMRVI